MKHELIATKRNRGGSPIKGMRTHAGTDVKCSCGGWKDYTNEAPPSASKTWRKKVFATHLASNTLESDIERGTALLAKATEQLTQMIVKDDMLPSFVEAQTAKIARIGKELATDLTEQRYGFRKG